MVKGATGCCKRGIELSAALLRGDAKAMSAGALCGQLERVGAISIVGALDTWTLAGVSGFINKLTERLV
jgi:hypothetical protein